MVSCMRRGLLSLFFLLAVCAALLTGIGLASASRPSEHPRAATVGSSLLSFVERHSLQRPGGEAIASAPCSEEAGRCVIGCTVPVAAHGVAPTTGACATARRSEPCLEFIAQETGAVGSECASGRAEEVVPLGRLRAKPRAH